MAKTKATVAKAKPAKAEKPVVKANANSGAGARSAVFGVGKRYK